jgi:hypothetical protein
MRRTVQVTLLSGVILGLAAALGSGSSPHSAYAKEGCNNHSLRGAYGFASDGQAFDASGKEVAEIAAAGRIVFDGRGGLTGRETESFSGVISDIPFSGSYSVQPDCTGTAIIHNGQTAHLKLMLVEGGQEVNFIDQDPGVVAVGQISQQQLGRCTNASLKGVYNFAISGSFYVPPGGEEQGDAAVFGRIDFDGRGHDTESASASFNGFQQDSPQTAIYTVNPDCTGSAISTHATGQQDFVNFVLVEGGTEIKVILTNPGAVFAGSVDKASTEQGQQN